MSLSRQSLLVAATAATVVIAMPLMGSRPGDQDVVLQLEVTYTNGGVDFGSICGVPILPTEVCFNVTFVGNRFADNVTRDAVLTAHIEFGDAVWTEADLEFFEVNYAQGQGGVFGLNWQMFPIDTSQVLCTLTANFPLTIQGTCIADGQDFQYTYTDSSSVISVPDCGDFPCGNNDQKVLLCHAPPGNPANEHTLCISPNAVDAHLENHEGDHCGRCDGVPSDLDGDGAVRIPDFLMLLEAWGSCPVQPDACPADLDLDSIVGATDLLMLLGNWG